MITMVMMITIIIMIMMICMIFVIVMLDCRDHYNHHDHHDHHDHMTSASPIVVISVQAWALRGHSRLPPTSAHDFDVPPTLLGNPCGLSSTRAPIRPLLPAPCPLFSRPLHLRCGLLDPDNFDGRRPAWSCMSWCSVDEKRQQNKEVLEGVWSKRLNDVSKIAPLSHPAVPRRHF